VRGSDKAGNSEKHMATDMEFFVDPNRCIGCHACEHAENNILFPRAGRLAAAAARAGAGR
jgi:Fe-S-cluster-containing dehydrogenase component